MNKVILRELSEELKFDHWNTRYRHKPESILEYKTHKILGDFEIQTDHLIPGGRPQLEIVNKKKSTFRQKTE